MWPFSKKEEKLPFDGVPAYRIIPAPHGKYYLYGRQLMSGFKPTFSGAMPYLYCAPWLVGTYDTIEEAELNAKHLGINDKEIQG